jgi:hypothetical protein
MRPSNRPLRSLLAASSLLLLAAMIGCGDGKPPRKDRHHDDRVSAEATEAPSQSDTSDEGKKDKHKHDKDKRDEGAATNAASTASSDDGKKADKRTHDHTAKPTDVQWLLTMHGEEGKPQGKAGRTPKIGPLQEAEIVAAHTLWPDGARGFYGEMIAKYGVSRDTIERILRRSKNSTQTQKAA